MKCGPDECPIVAFSDLTPTEQRTERKRVAEKMYKQGFTEQQIATQLGVTQKTISQDLNGVYTQGINSHRTSKRGRKGEGRPKGKRRARNSTVVEQAVASLVLDQGKTQKAAVAELEVGSEQIAKTAVAREQGRREMMAELLDAAAAKNFSDKGKLRIEDAIRIHTARLNKQFEQRVNEEVRRRIAAADDATRASNKELRKENAVLQRIVHNRAVFTLEQFRQMQMLCHPDSSASEKTKAQLSQLLAENKIKLVKEAA